MVKILIESCARTAAGGMTVGEITAAVLTVVVGVYFGMNRHVKNNKSLLVIIMFAVPTLAALLGQLGRSCEENLKSADALTTKELDKPTCVKSYSGLTLFQLAYVVLAVIVTVWARGNSDNSRFMALGFLFVSVISWLVGLLFGKECAASLE